MSDRSSSTIIAQDSKIAAFRNPAVGDTIIQTKDSVTFHVSKCVLVIASAYFGAPKSIMRVDEDSDVWVKLLRLSYLSLAESNSIPDVGPLTPSQRGDIR